MMAIDGPLLEKLVAETAWYSEVKDGYGLVLLGHLDPWMPLLSLVCL